MAEPDLSIVIPVFNEAGNLALLHAELAHVLAKLALSCEILFVDDASTDASARIMRELCNQDARVRIVSHVINCGESAAQASGLRQARGELVLTMDGDLQNDPLDIPRFLAALTAGVDCVCGVRTVRRDSLTKRISSQIGNSVRNLLTGDHITDAGCTYRLMRRTALCEVPVFNGMHRFLPTLLRAQGYRISEIRINDRPRQHGVSKYGINNRLWRGLYDCLGVRWYLQRAVPAERCVRSIAAVKTPGLMEPARLAEAKH